MEALALALLLLGEAVYESRLVDCAVARRVDNPEDAADLTAEVFLASIKASRTYRGEAAPLAWLYGIARNVVSSHHRSSARARRASSSAAGHVVLDADATDRIVARIDSQRQARELYQSLAALPERQRALVELVAVDGLLLTEAAIVLGISAGNARVRYHRARQRLAQDLTHFPTDLYEVTS